MGNSRYRIGTMPHGNPAEDLLEDLRGALRYFGRNRVFFATAVLVPALGIGGATAVFSVS